MFKNIPLYETVRYVVHIQSNLYIKATQGNLKNVALMSSGPLCIG